MSQPGSSIVDISFANGEVYKTTHSYGNSAYVDMRSLRESDGCVSRYRHADSEFCDDIFSLFSVKKYPDGSTKLKYYKPSTEFCKILLGDDTQRGEDLSNYDLCPSASLWVGIATYQNNDDVELFFAIDDDASLMEVSKYYSLPFPLPDTESIDKSPNEWHCLDFAGSSEKAKSKCDSKFKTKFLLGSLKIENGVNIMLKMFKSNPNPRGN